MSKGGKSNRDVFDIERLKDIVKLMQEHDLSEVDLQQGDDKIKLGRGSSAAPVYMPPPTAPAPSTPAALPATSPGSSAPSTEGTITIDAPMIGTFYSRANPESEPFVKVGQKVTEETIVCIVEAMKVFNEIPAECRGTVVEILINDQEPVDFGKPMFRIDPNA